ncbi:MAG: hypothetical protein JXA82_02305 [Sedimentisphaerales bacterium]|nr:hypothetical protein [Sedimentisphaerales bacterium]
MNNERENLKELLRQFYEQDRADQIEADIEWGDRTMGQWPRLQPDAKIIGKIKKKIHKRLHHRNRNGYRLLVSSIASIAAVLVLGTAVLIYFSQPPFPTTHTKVFVDEITPQTWQIDSLGDEQLAEIATELDEIMDTMLDLQLDEYGSIKENDIDGYQGKTETAVVTNDFWKG